MSGRGEQGHPPFFANAQVMAIDPADVFVPERIGFLHEDKAVALGRLMAVDGQRDPIKVAPRKGKQPWKLVTGRHRLRGAEIEGIPVYAIEVGGDEADHADLEASENVHRRKIEPIERAKFTAALVRATQERIARDHGDLSQHQLAIKARWDRVKHGEELAEQALQDETEDTCANIAHVYGWEESVSDALDMSRRTIHDDLSIFRLIVEPFPDLVEGLAKHPVVGRNGSQLKKIVALRDERNRRRVIEALLADQEIGVEDAKIVAGLPGSQPEATPVNHQKAFDAIKNRFTRLDKRERSLLLPEFASLLTPGEKRHLRDQLNKELGDG